MKRLIVLSMALAVGFLALCSSALAVTLDPVSYMGLIPGKWGITQEPGGSLQGFKVTNGTNGRIVQAWYNNSQSGWTFDSADVFKVTSTTVQHIGLNDGKDLWVFNPVLTLPRPMVLNHGYAYTGVATNQRTLASQPFVCVIVVTKKGLNVNINAGDFSNCTQIQTYEHIPGQSRESTVLSAPGRAGLMSWISKIRDTSNLEQETQDGFSNTLIQFGDSSPPF